MFSLCAYDEFTKCKTDYLTTDADAYLACVWSCFEKNPLDFVADSQALQYRDDTTKIMSVGPRSTNKTAADGALPAGSLWREIPISDPGDGRKTWDYVNSFSDDATKALFEGDFGVKGAQEGNYRHNPHDWNILDQVKVPVSLPKGKYVMSWRYDCFMADQVWSNCADVELVGDALVNAPTPSGLVNAPTPSGLVDAPTPSGLVDAPTPSGLVDAPTSSGSSAVSDPSRDSEQSSARPGSSVLTVFVWASVVLGAVLV